jgi:hypothetical protein
MHYIAIPDITCLFSHIAAPFNRLIVTVDRVRNIMALQ